MTDLFKLILGILASRFKREPRWKRHLRRILRG
jgi:hypothetical protein